MSLTGVLSEMGARPHNELDLGMVIAEDWTIPEYLANYIDYEAIGRDFTCSGWFLFEGIAICRG